MKVRKKLADNHQGVTVIGDSHSCDNNYDTDHRLPHAHLPQVSGKSKSGEAAGGEAAAKSASRSAKAGLQFPVVLHQCVGAGPPIMLPFFVYLTTNLTFRYFSTRITMVNDRYVFLFFLYVFSLKKKLIRF